MATFYLINTVKTPDGTKRLPGSLIDDSVIDTTALIAAGAELEASSNATVAAAAAKAQAAHTNRGANESEMESIMRSALDTSQDASLGAVPQPAITAPADVTRAAAVIGTNLSYARSDHKHDIALATPSVAGVLSPADKTKLDTMQAGTGTLVAGTATIAANITALSRITVSMKDPGAGAITGFAGFKVPAAARVVGAPGSFDVTAIDDAKATIATAVCTFDWMVEN